MLKFIVMSDLHIVETGETSQGLDTFLRLERAIAHINSYHADADFCVLAGDLADLGFKGAEKPYSRMKTALDRLEMPYHVTIGNHDSRALFLGAFGEELRAETGCVDKVVDLKGYRVIVLDSVFEEDEHSHGGHLSQRQLDWLQSRLDEHAGPVVVVLHHHANPLHVRVDRIILENGEQFAQVLKTHSDIRQVICGHVHFSSCGLWHGIPFTTLAGNHYSVTVPLEADAKVDRLWGPAQIAVVIGNDVQTLVHFDNFLDGNLALA